MIDARIEGARLRRPRATSPRSLRCPPGAPHVAWGDFAHFTAYTGQLNHFAPIWLMPILAWVATLAEIGAGVFLLAGLYTRIAAHIA